MLLKVLVPIFFLFCAPGENDEKPASSYGFAGLEIYKVDRGISDLSFADLNGDGREDLGFINDARSRVELFLRLPDDAPDVYEITDPEKLNELTYDGRFKKEFLPLEQGIRGLTFGRFDDDEVMDVAVVTDTNELVLIYRGAERKTLRLEEFKPLRYGIEGKDIDNDGRDDLLLLGEKKTLLWLRKDEDWLKKPQVLYNLQEKPQMLRLADLDGDGFRDLLYVYFQGEYPFQIRFQKAPGHFGPVTAPRLKSIRAFALEDVNGDGREDVLAVYRSSGRMVLFTLEKSEEPFFRHYPLRDVKEADAITYTVADVDDDGMAEIIAADGSAARVLLIDGLGGGGAMEEREFPSLRDVRDPRVTDLDRDGEKELVVISGTEQVIGISSLGEEIGFPKFVPVEGEPAAMDVGDVNGDGADDAVCISTRGIGSKKEYLFNVYDPSISKGEVRSSVIEQDKKKKFLKKDPSDLLLVDLNRDGLDDVMLFVPDEVPVVFLNRGEGSFEFSMGAETPGLGILKKARSWTVCPADADDDGRLELAACSGNLARFIYVPEQGKVPQAVRQYNSKEPGDVFIGSAYGDVAGGGEPELILYESRTKRLHVIGKDGSLLMDIDVGGSEFRGVEAVELNGDGKKDLLVKGRDRIGVYLTGTPSPALKEKGTYESRDKETYFLDVAVGDVNHDGAADSVLVDSGQKSLFIVSLAGGSMTHVMKFKVFEEKLFQSRKGGAEPHGIKIRDLTGDGKEDVIVLVHDKIIIYPQE